MTRKLCGLEAICVPVLLSTGCQFLCPETVRDSMERRALDRGTLRIFPKEQLTHHDKAVLLEPANPELWMAKAAALTELGWPREALRCLHQAIKLNPSDAKPWLRRGTLLLALGEPRRAREHFHRALQLQPDLYAQIHEASGQDSPE